VNKSELNKWTFNWHNIICKKLFSEERADELSQTILYYLFKTIILQMLKNKGIAEVSTPLTCKENEILPDDLKIQIQKSISRKNLNKLSFDVLSDVYESHPSLLGSKKDKGLYYTPSYIIHYVVDQTLGRYLWGTESGRSEGNRPIKSPEEISDLRILDPACGSGCFLSYAFDVLAEFYSQIPVNPHKEIEYSPLEHLYGIDFDNNAINIAKTILILKAFEAGYGEYSESSINVKHADFLLSEFPFLHTKHTPVPLSRGEFTINSPLERGSRGVLNSIEKFNLIIGNPPHGARLSRRDRKLIRSKFETFRSPDSSSLFIEKSIKLMDNDGILAFVVPKSLSYVISWKDIRRFILDNCKVIEIADVSEAFDRVLLEQMVIFAQRKSKIVGFLEYGVENNQQGKFLNPPSPLFQRGNSILSFQKENDSISPFSKGDKRDLRPTQDSFPNFTWKNQILSDKHYQLRITSHSSRFVNRSRKIALHTIDSRSLNSDQFLLWLNDPKMELLLDKIWKKSVPLEAIAEIWNGLNIQKLPIFSDCPDSEHILPCVMGRDINHYKIKNVRYAKLTDNIAKSLVMFNKPKIVTQDIVSYVQHPKPHIKIISAIDSENCLNVSTVTNITSTEYNLEYLCGILNSRFISWYAYNFIYNRASRTMHFRKGYADQIPICRIKNDNAEDLHLSNELIKLVNQITLQYNDDISDIYSRIEGIIHQLYGITDDELIFLEQFMGFY
jgi:type I restriction-modification system DNA methylase subunit